MATFMSYASCHGNKPALQLMGMNERGFSFLGTPPCLMSRRQRRARPKTELSVMQLTHLIKVLQQLPDQSTDQGSQDGPGRAVRGVSRSCHPGIFGSHCLFCIQDRNKQKG